VIEVTPDKRIVWEFGASDAPELNITWVSSIQQRKNGNLIIGDFLRGQEGKPVNLRGSGIVRNIEAEHGRVDCQVLQKCHPDIQRRCDLRNREADSYAAA
jgi:hypothetical protein